MVRPRFKLRCLVRAGCNQTIICIWIPAPPLVNIVIKVKIYFLSLVLIVQRYDVVFLGEGPPPLEHRLGAHAEVFTALLLLQLDDELPDRLEGGGGPPVVGHPGHLAAELQDLLLLVSGQPHLLQDPHPAGLAEDVVVEGPLGYPVLDTGLGEPELLVDDAVDGLVHLCLGPGRILDMRSSPAPQTSFHCSIKIWTSPFTGDVMGSLFTGELKELFPELSLLLCLIVVEMVLVLMVSVPHRGM